MQNLLDVLHQGFMSTLEIHQPEVYTINTWCFPVSCLPYVALHLLELCQPVACLVAQHNFSPHLLSNMHVLNAAWMQTRYPTKICSYWKQTGEFAFFCSICLKLPVETLLFGCEQSCYFSSFRCFILSPNSDAQYNYSLSK
jgi:hypothetical protein